jgi:hypothetical protein
MSTPSKGPVLTSFVLALFGLEAPAEAAVQCQRTLVANVVALDWPVATYDVIAAIFIQFATPEERTRLFAWFMRALKPGGLLVLQGYRVEQLGYGTGGPPERDHLYSAAMVRKAFAGCEILELATYDEEIHEGAGHNGMSALLGATLRKR